MKACPAGCDGGYFDNGTCVADTCDRCEGEGRVESWYDRLPGARGLRRQYHVRRYMLDRRLERARHWRGLWREYRTSPHLQTVATWKAVHRNMLEDQPMLRSVIEREMAHDVKDYTPLAWRLEAIRRIWRGDLVDPYEYSTSVMVREDHSDFFQRNAAMLVLEVHRRPKAPKVLRVDEVLTPERAADLLRAWPDAVQGVSGGPAGNGDVPCPNDGELVNVRCWKCGWDRP